MVGVSTIRVLGPLALYAEGFYDDLVRMGYTARTARDHTYVLAHLSRWLRGEGLDPAVLEPLEVERFLVARRRAGYRRWLTLRSLRPLLEYLRRVGVVPAAKVPVVESAAERLLAEYRRYLAVERRLAPTTVRGHVDIARRFLSTRSAGEGGDLGGLTPSEVAAFVVAQSGRYSAGSMRALTTALRSLLRFGFVTGIVAADLRGAVPAVANRAEALPRSVDPLVVARLLDSCDRSTEVGARDFAVLMLLVRLGLRAGEVAGLLLDDIDWRAGELTIRGKGGRVDRLPLPADVGAALADYLHALRPRSACRAVFWRTCGPQAPMSARSAVMVPRCASVRAGMPVVGAHRLRHTAATRMLGQGASLPEIAQVMRHHDQSTTAIYAKVDRAALDLVVRPWGAGQ